MLFIVVDLPSMIGYSANWCSCLFHHIPELDGNNLPQYAAYLKTYVLLLHRQAQAVLHNATAVGRVPDCCDIVVSNFSPALRPVNPVYTSCLV
jgi:hypothetical protein